jgi:outer membrane protein assembly complex protein YaeT
VRNHFILARSRLLAAVLVAMLASPLAAQSVPGAQAPDAGKTAEIPTLPSLTNLNAFQGLRIRSVRLRGIREDSRTFAHIKELIAQKAGQPLDRQTVRQTVQALYTTGRFSNIAVEVRREGEQEVTLVFSVSPNYFVGAVTATGAPSRQRPTNGQLVDAAKLQLGEVVTPGKIEQAMQRMKTTLQVNGFYRAQIARKEDLDAGTQLEDIHFKVTPNEPAHIGQVLVEGDSGYTLEEIEKFADLEPGHTVTQDRLTKALQRLRKEYTKQERLESQINIVDRKYHADTNLVDFYLRIERGPTVAVRLEGASIGHGRLKRLVPVYEEHAVDNDLLNEGRRNIRDFLQTEGYFDAKVNFTEDYTEQRAHLNVVYDVDRGDKHQVVKVRFAITPGKYIPAIHKQPPYFRDPELEPLLQVQSKTYVATQGKLRHLFGGLSASHGRYSQVMMSQDVQSLTAQYHENGFLGVKVEGVVQDNFQGKAGDIAVIYKIDEGPQTEVGHVTVEGNSAFNSDVLSSALNTKTGQPYSEENVQKDRDSVLNLYFDKGFPNVEFESKIVPSPGKPDSMDVTYQIREGEQFFVDRVLMSQLRYTRPAVAERQFAIKPGDPLSQTLMSRTQANLYNLGIFNEVKIGVQNPDGDAKYKDVLLQVQEARRWTFDYGFGVEASTGQPSQQDCQKLAEEGQNSVACSQGRYGVSPKVSFDVSRINFRGRAHTLTLQTSIGRLEQRVLFNDEVKRFFDNPNWVFSFTTFYDNSVDVTTFTSERLEGSVQLQQTYSKITQFLYRFTYRRVKASNVVVSTDQIPIFSEPVRVGIPSFTYIRDKRDNVIDTHNGNYTTFDIGVASRYFGSQASFGRFLVQNSTYQPFKKKTVGGQTTMWVFARNTQIGIADPFANTVVPLPERFLAGGASSLRGFALNQAGPRDLSTGSPLGGNALFINSLELRTPPLALPFVEDNLSFEFFNDIGNVFVNGTDMVHGLFRFHQPNAQQCGINPAVCNFSYMSNAVGSGIRYRTPIGPVRVDFGYNLNPTTYSLAITNNNITSYTPQNTRRINVFFSIGQTF